MNAHRIPFYIEDNPLDQHVILRVSLKPGKTTLRLKIRNDFAISYSHSLPALGSTSRDLRILSEIWNTKHDELTVQLAGIAGSRYELGTSNPAQVRSVDGAEFKNDKLIVTFASDNSQGYVPHTAVVHFASANRRGSGFTH